MEGQGQRSKSVGEVCALLSPSSFYCLTGLYLLSQHSLFNPPPTLMQLPNFKESSSVLGMHISWPKTKLRNLSTGNQLSTIPMFNGNVVKPVEDFLYLAGANLVHYGNSFTNVGLVFPITWQHGIQNGSVDCG